jgi:hypothetical protein
MDDQLVDQQLDWVEVGPGKPHHSTPEPGKTSDSGATIEAAMYDMPERNVPTIEITGCFRIAAAGIVVLEYTAWQRKPFDYSGVLN